jgi:putative membrane protein
VSGGIAFSDRVLYPSYNEAPSLFGITPLQDQVFAGALMWVFGLFVCMVPAVFITLKLLSPRVI